MFVLSELTSHRVYWFCVWCFFKITYPQFQTFLFFSGKLRMDPKGDRLRKIQSGQLKLPDSVLKVCPSLFTFATNNSLLHTMIYIKYKLIEQSVLTVNCWYNRTLKQWKYLWDAVVSLILLLCQHFTVKTICCIKLHRLY